VGYSTLAFGVGVVRGWGLEGDEGGDDRAVECLSSSSLSHGTGDDGRDDGQSIEMLSSPVLGAKD
jgi:hypothetical protein